MLTLSKLFFMAAAILKTALALNILTRITYNVEVASINEPAEFVFLNSISLQIFLHTYSLEFRILDWFVAVEYLLISKFVHLLLRGPTIWIDRGTRQTTFRDNTLCTPPANFSSLNEPRINLKTNIYDLKLLTGYSIFPFETRIRSTSNHSQRTTHELLMNKANRAHDLNNKFDNSFFCFEDGAGFTPSLVSEGLIIYQ